MSRPTQNEQWVGITIAAALVLLVAAVRSFGAEAQHKSVLAFGMESCYQCQFDKKHYPAIEKKHGRVQYVDMEKYPQLAAAWNVKVGPTYVVLVNGKEIFRTHYVNDLLK